MKKVYRIRNKRTKEFVSLGYSSKNSWSNYPSEAIKYNLPNKEDYEVVVQEYDLIKEEVIDFR